VLKSHSMDSLLLSMLAAVNKIRKVFLYKIDTAGVRITKCGVEIVTPAISLSLCYTAALK